MYVQYKLKDKPLFTFSSVKYAVSCINCNNLTTRKLLISKGVLAKELYRGIQKEAELNPPYSYSHWSGHFICSEKCIKELSFRHCLKGNVKIRKRIEEWLNSPPQEFFNTITDKKIIVRVIKNQKDDMNYVEFYKKGNRYCTCKNIQFMAPTEYLMTLTSGINNLFNS